MAGTTNDMTGIQKLGILVIVISSGFTAMEMGGFGFGLQLDLPVSLAISAAGGGLGGAMLARRSRLLGFVCGLLAGPCGLLGVYYYVRGRQEVWNVELVAVQGAASLPAVGLYHLVCQLLPSPDENPPIPDEGQG